MHSTQLVFMFLLTIFELSCNKSDQIIKGTLPNGIYEIRYIIDINNNGNATDLRVKAKYLKSFDIHKVKEIRLVISKANELVDAYKLKTLPVDYFFSVPVSDSANQIFKIGNIKDASGANIVNNTGYEARIATITHDDQVQLSNSMTFTLRDKPIYSGDYIGTWEDLGPPGPAMFDMSLTIQEDYTGSMFYANADFKPFGKGMEDAKTKISITGTTINSFDLSQFIVGYGTNNCKATSTLKGRITDEIHLSLDTFVWDDCDGKREVKLNFSKVK